MTRSLTFGIYFGGIAALSLVAEPSATAQSAMSAVGVPATAEAPAGAGGVPLSLLDVVKNTLSSHPNIAAARTELAARTASLGLARGSFDPRFTAGLSHTHDVTPMLPAQRSIYNERAIVNDTTDLSVGAAWTTEVGTTLTPSVGLSRIHQRLQDSMAPAGLGDPYQQAHVGISARQPLLRGAGSVGAASAIGAARASRGAAEHNLAQTAQEQVYGALVAYWQLVATNRQRGLLRTTEGNAQRLVDETKVLVAADQRPRSDLRQLEGNLANRHRAVVEAENNRLQALHALALAMGYGLEQSADWEPRDDFPPLPNVDVSPAQAVQKAKTTRSDIKAAQASVAAAASALRGAEWNTNPALDLNMSLGYNGALDKDGVDAFAAATARNVRGVNAGLGLSLELPFNNTAQLADRDLKRAQYEQARIAAGDLNRTLPVAVMQALDDLRLSSAALAAASEAVSQYEFVVTDQREKLRAGVGTVIDMVLTEELLISAQQNQTANRLRCAVASTRLLFETGALPKAVEDAVRSLAPLTAPPGAHDASQ
jgi:outer membrane protein TolC